MMLTRYNTLFLEKPSLLRDSFGRFTKNHKKLDESFSSIDDLKSQLNEKMIAIMNESSGGTGDWNLSSKWTDAWNNAGSVKESNALIEIFIQIACPSWGCKLENLDPGKDVIIKLIDELGFKENENPYLNFIKTFYRENGTGVTLGYEDWVKLNDWYANDIISESDLNGTGFDRGNHIIFNKNTYLDGNISSDNDNYVRIFSLMSNKQTIMKLNLYAMATFEGSPYGKLASLTKDGVKGTGVYQGGDFREVRNIVFYKNPSKPLGDLYPLYYVQRAFNDGMKNIYKAEADEIATGSSSIDLKREISDVVGKIKTILKELKKKVDQYIKDYAAKHPKSVVGTNKITATANKYLQEDVDAINDFISKLKSSKNKKEYDDTYSKLSNYINNGMKTKSLISELSSLSPSSIEKGATKAQKLTYNDIEDSFDDLSKSDLTSLVKLLKKKGVIS